jgi:FkbM family methyltransferase
MNILKSKLKQIIINDRETYSFLKENYSQYCDYKERRLLYKMYSRLFAETFKDKEKKIGVFDIGANKGQYTRVFRKLDCWVTAVEPVDNVREILIKTFYNDKFTNIYSYVIGGKGTWDKPIKKSFYIGNYTENSTLIKNNSPSFRDIKYNKKIEVLMISLKSLIEYEGTPDYIKIDTEGYEYQVLSTLNKPIKLISFEFSGDFNKLIKCMDKINNLGDYEFNFESGDCNRWLILNDEWLSRGEIIKIFTQLKLNMGDVFARLKDI